MFRFSPVSLHARGRVERAGRFKHDADLLTCFIASRDGVCRGFPRSPVPLILCAVAQQVASQGRDGADDGRPGNGGGRRRGGLGTETPARNDLSHRRVADLSQALPDCPLSVRGVRLKGTPRHAETVVWAHLEALASCC